MIEQPILTAAALMVGLHFLLDFPLQGDFLSKAKNPTAPIPGVPWQWAMSAHAMIQGFGVAVAAYIVTGGNTAAACILWALEALMHGAIDTLKCTGGLTFGQDQIAHLACKFMWVLFLGIALGG